MHTVRSQAEHGQVLHKVEQRRPAALAPRNLVHKGGDGELPVHPVPAATTGAAAAATLGPRSGHDRVQGQHKFPLQQGRDAAAAPRGAARGGVPGWDERGRPGPEDSRRNLARQRSELAGGVGSRRSELSRGRAALFNLLPANNC